MPGVGRRQCGASVGGMGERTQYTPGTFSWTDCTTTDQEGAKAFYSALFGWELEDNPVGDGVVYTMATLNGHPVAAISPQPEQQRDAGAPPVWNSYITVRERRPGAHPRPRTRCHRPCRRLRRHGRGPYGRDPGSAGRVLPGVAAQPAHRRPAGQRARRPVLERARLPRPRRVGRVLQRAVWLEHRADGGLRPAVSGHQDGRRPHERRDPAADAPEAPPFWLVYFACEDIDASLAKVSELGGSALGPAIDIGIAKIGVAQDPQGAVFALYAGPAGRPEARSGSRASYSGGCEAAGC